MQHALILRIFFRWVPLAGLATALSLLLYLAVQQVYRETADDPQVQMAHEIARELDAGLLIDAVVPARAVDIGVSLAPYVMVLDEGGHVVASSGQLHNEPRIVPIGVLDHVRARGEERVTWQPERGVRVATVVVRRAGATPGFVLVGRSLGESDARTFKFGQLVALAWAATLCGLLVLVGVSEYALSTESANTP